MRAIRSFPVRAPLPESLQPLFAIAMNLRWTWDARSVQVFTGLDPDAWERSQHDPIKMLGLVSKARAEAAAQDRAFMSSLTEVAQDLSRYTTEPRWFQKRGSTTALGTIAYFSPEFGVSETMPIYSGGLGILAGDHLKAASDLGVPLVGVGLLYKESFRQQLDASGWQQERYPGNDPYAMPLRLLSADDGRPVRIMVDLAGASCHAQVWRADVGRTPLLLLDCDVEGNAPSEREVTNRLYFGDSEHRLRQEILLGIGGVRALEAAGFEPNVWHSNEGHAGFLGLERIRRLVQTQNLTFAEALEAVRSTTIFTTHTPVPAGIDIYSGELMERHFSRFAEQCNITLEELLELGRVQPPEPDEPDDFNMAVMGFRLAGRANGVSKLHGEVSRTIFASVWPDVPAPEVPIGAVTNGVHAPTWLGSEMHDLLGADPDAGTSTPARWAAIANASDGEVWSRRNQARSRLITFVRERLRGQLRARGQSETETAWTKEALDPDVLTIGFARRFAQYKRATLILTDQDRLRRLITSSEGAVQFVFSGKAHAADDGGKEMIRQLVSFASDPEIRQRLVFLEDYDMQVARNLCQGVDVWLNNPRRPLEASGTSGMKAALNGVLNCSILDGWWDECFAPDLGWSIADRNSYDDLGHQDYVEANALYDVLERDVIPCFYDRARGDVPARWLHKVKASVSRLGPFITAERMLRDYIDNFYEPAARQGRDISADGFARARRLASWKAGVRDTWEEVAVLDVAGDVAPAEIDEVRNVTATVRLGRLDTGDVSVQLAHGNVGPGGELEQAQVVEMKPQAYENGACRFEGSFVPVGPGLYGYTVRVLPSHPDLIERQELGLVEWSH